MCRLAAESDEHEQTLIATDYRELDIQAGGMASMIYADLDRIDNKSERQRIRESLLEYCKLDTLARAMVWRDLGAIACGK